MYALLDASDEHCGRLGGMWVAADHCGVGHGRRLVDHVIAWARDSQLRTVRFWVDELEGPAKRLYLGAGFLLTGEVDATKEKIDKALVEMSLDLS